MATAASLARNLGARRQGDNWRCDCPLDCGYSVSLSDGAEGRLLVYCHGGCAFQDICTALVEYGLLDDDPIEPLQHRERDTAQDRARHIKQAWAIYQQGISPHNTLVEKYLHVRRLTLPEKSPLRFHPSCPHRTGIRLPAMIAPILGRSGAQIGIHMTYLHPSGSGKADFANPDDQRECRGMVRGGTIRLSPLDPKRELAITEGVENGLAVMEIFRLPVWAAVSAGNLKNSLDLPLAAQCVVIATDNDLSGTGQNAALTARVRWQHEGRAVRIVMPRIPGDDFNDVMRRR